MAKHTIVTRLADQLLIVGDTVVRLRPQQRSGSSFRNLIDKIKSGGFRVSDSVEGLKESSVRTYIYTLEKNGLVKILEDKTTVWCGEDVNADHMRFGAKGELKIRGSK